MHKLRRSLTAFLGALALVFTLSACDINMVMDVHSDGSMSMSAEMYDTDGLLDGQDVTCDQIIDVMNDPDLQELDTNVTDISANGTFACRIESKTPKSDTIAFTDNHDGTKTVSLDGLESGIDDMESGMTAMKASGMQMNFTIVLQVPGKIVDSNVTGEVKDDTVTWKSLTDITDGQYVTFAASDAAAGDGDAAAGDSADTTSSSPASNIKTASAIILPILISLLVIFLIVIIVVIVIVVKSKGKNSAAAPGMPGMPYQQPLPNMPGVTPVTPPSPNPAAGMPGMNQAQPSPAAPPSQPWQMPLPQNPPAQPVNQPQNPPAQPAQPTNQPWQPPAR